MYSHVSAGFFSDDTWMTKIQFVIQVAVILLGCWVLALIGSNMIRFSVEDLRTWLRRSRSSSQPNRPQLAPDATEDIEYYSTLHSWYKHLSYNRDSDIVYPILFRGKQIRNSLTPAEDPNRIHWHFLEMCDVKRLKDQKLARIISKFPVGISGFLYSDPTFYVDLSDKQVSKWIEQNHLDLAKLLQKCKTDKQRQEIYNEIARREHQLQKTQLKAQCYESFNELVQQGYTLDDFYKTGKELVK